jgi:very-short-patch-repair endonuclease
MSTLAPIENVLLRTRSNLLDLTLRNRLLNTPRAATRSKRLDIVDEKSDEVFRILVRDQKVMTFLASKEQHETDQSENRLVADIFAEKVPNPTDLAVAQTAYRHVDTRLQTTLTLPNLQKRLLTLHTDAKTMEEEQGVSILYLACGFLEWYESSSSDLPRFSPLLLIPVYLERPNVAERFRLKYRESEISTNLSLQAKLAAEFAIKLPDIPDEDDLVPSAYFASVEVVIKEQSRWRVHRDDMTLWFFSFAKYLMYRDLDPDSWPEDRPLLGNAIIRGLLSEGFRSDPPICGDDDRIDEIISPADMTHVTDADSSQAVVIEEVRRGRNLVVQGPPGTGKSQTITNIIATAVKEGKKVLFVAEKMAALEVVKSRLNRLGLGSMIIELHSHKSNKRIVLEELDRTLKLGRPKVVGAAATIEQLKQTRDRLNRHADAMNGVIEPANVTPYQIFGEMTKYSAESAMVVPFNLDDPASWTKEAFRQKCQRLDDFLIHAKEIGPPLEHPWRGVRQSTRFLPSEITQIKQDIDLMLAQLDKAESACRFLCYRLKTRLPDPLNIQLSKRLTDIGEWSLAVPQNADRKALAGDVWLKKGDKIRALVKNGSDYATARCELDSKIAPSGWELDPGPIRLVIAAYGRSWLKFLRADYRKAINTLKGILNEPLPISHDDRLALVDSLSRVRQMTTELNSFNNDLGKEAFGEKWDGLKSNWDDLVKLIEWDEFGLSRKILKYRVLALQNIEKPSLANPIRELREAIPLLLQKLKQLTQKLDLDTVETLGNSDLQAISFSTLRQKLTTWRDYPDELSKWIIYSIHAQELRKEGLSELLTAYDAGQVTVENAAHLFRQKYCESMTKWIWATRSELTRFDGKSHGTYVDEFRRLDQERIQLAQKEVAAAHFDRMPHESDRGDMSIILREIAKKRRHLPIRKLLKEAGRAVQSIKPVFMMSPISVAQFLEPGGLEFDLLVMDEASQVSTEDALGAMARAKQIVVVGDTKQLPPSRFFSRVMDDAPFVGDDETDQTSDIESVLTLCLARGVSQRMLRWHYRSRHHSLIAVSNREFYDERLCVIPSPSKTSSSYGLQFRYVKDGIFDRGGSATNKIEARTVAEAIIEHAKQFPNLSLGVGTFSVSQRDAILDELEQIQRQNPDTEKFFGASRDEPFFVKNLENIQGDERDVIFISVGYAKDASGFQAMSFGPLSSDGGERRLNVLITRAKERCVVFSSMKSDEIDLNRANGFGPRALKTFLRFAEIGEMDIPTTTSADYDSEFERQVAIALRQHGYRVDQQVGTVGFFIDLAVVDPDMEGRYLIGIECDGATYHSSRSARDRDRLREQVLRDRGWQIHRIWSTDWFHRRDEQLKKTIAAIEAARRATPNSQLEKPIEASPTVEREPVSKSTITNNVGILNYTEADFDVPRSNELYAEPTEKIAEYMKRIVEIEGPIHYEEATRRLSTLWGYQRVGNRIESAISRGVDQLIRIQSVLKVDNFLYVAGQQTILPRNREGTKSNNLRKPEFISTIEIRNAIELTVSKHAGLIHDELADAVARLFGVKITTAKLRDQIETTMQDMVKNGLIVIRDRRVQKKN